MRHARAAKHVVRGQYGRGLRRGEARCPATARSRASREDSTTETFVAAKLYVDNWRWAGHALLRPHRQAAAEARDDDRDRVQARAAPAVREGGVAEGLRPNVLLVHVQPDEGVSLAIGAKVPGQGMTIRTVHMDFLYGGAFRTELPEAYERLILDCLLGDATLFTRADEVDEQWALVDSIVAAWTRDRPALPELRRGHLGAGRGRRAPPPGRTRSGADAEGHLRRRDRAAARRAARARGAVAADERADAHGVGAARVVARGRRACSRARRARPVAHDPAPPRPRREASTGSTRTIEHECFPGGGHGDLRGGRPHLAARPRRRARRRASSSRCRSPTCPVFLRWRGRPPFGRPQFEQLVGVADRLIVDSTEWDRLPGAYARLAGAVRPGRRLRPRVGADAPLRRGARRALAGDRARRGGCGSSARAPTRCSCAAGCAPGSGATFRLGHEAARRLDAGRGRRRARRAGPRRPRVGRATCSPRSSRSSPATPSTRRPSGRCDVDAAAGGVYPTCTSSRKSPASTPSPSAISTTSTRTSST